MKDGLNLSQVHSANSYSLPPPGYMESTVQTKSKVEEESTYGNSPWLLRRTSIVVESEPSEQVDDGRSLARFSTCSTTKADEKGALRGLLNKFSNRPGQESLLNGKVVEETSMPSDSLGFGTKVSIEASQPRRVHLPHRHEMRGLEQAASMRRWPGYGRTAEPWGKLMKDPELWDPAGDTLVYFGYQRPHPSFRVRASVLEETRSEYLISKLQDGFRRPPKASSTVNPPSSSLKRMKSLNPSNVGHKKAPEGGDVDSEPQIRHKMHFPAPLDASRLDLLRCHITTRNFFALLLGKPLVGLTFYQALTDLHERLQVYMPSNTNCALDIVKLLMEHRLHNVCNDPAAAAGLLGWSEHPEVCWQEGWREGFVHCSGMYAQLRSMPEFRDISHISRALLERAHLEREVRIQEAEDRLSTFMFEDIRPAFNVHSSDTCVIFDLFRRFLQQFYEKAYKTWPPQKDKSSDYTWLTRTTVLQLEKDFGALYDYCVNREVVWKEAKERDQQIRTMVRNLDGAAVEVKSRDIRLAELFGHFDQKHKFSRIPHPYPLLPISIPVNDGEKKQKQPLFGSKRKALEKRIADAYSEASNVLLLEAENTSNSLVKAFVQFEKSDHPGEVDPRDARKGRWILLYGILQVISRISVDTPDLYFTDNVSYFLNPRLKGTPPWNYGADNMYEEASPKGSHCWRVIESWGKNGATKR